MDVTANRDQERVTALVEDDDVAILATVTQDADEVDVLEAISALDEELEIGLAVLGSGRAASTDDVQEAARELATDGGQAFGADQEDELLDRPALVEELKNAHNSYLGVAAHVANAKDEDALECVEDVRDALDEVEASLEGGV